MNQERQTWLGLLARANRDYLENIWATYNPGVPIQKLAGPETGLVHKLVRPQCHFSLVRLLVLAA